MSSLLLHTPNDVYAHAAEYFEAFKLDPADAAADAAAESGGASGGEAAGEIELDTGDATKEEIDAAATKMQATFRGKQSRKDVAAKKAEKEAATASGGD